MVFAALYNSTGLKYLEFLTDFKRLMSVVTDYNYYTIPENIDDIGTQIQNKYFPQEQMTDMNSVKVIFYKCLKFIYLYTKKNGIYSP